MKEILKDIFTKPYQGKSFVLDSLLKPLLGDYKPSNEDILHNSERKKLAEKANVKAITRIAEFELEDTTLQVFDITLSSHSKIKYSKVNIQKVVRSIMDVYTGAIMFFHYENNEGDWRISFVEKEDSQKNTTSAKRYTFLVGENHPATTITQRFVTLRGKEKLVEAIRDAFSVEVLSEEFFAKYKSHYEDFVQYISGKRFVKEKGKWVEKSIGQPSEEYISIFEENDKSVRDFVKKMLGRIVFLHFLQKKKWLCDDENYLQNLFKKSEKSNYLESVLEPLFFGVLNTKSEDRKVLFENENWDLSLLKEWENIPYLNGGLFEKDELDKKTVVFPENLFSDLFDFFSQYNFTIDENDPNDSEVGIDPEMLGKIFENLLEDNKDKGAFYTPKEIVQYMCRESLIAYLCEKHKDDEEGIRSLVEHHITDWNEDTRKKILNFLKDVKICDPAIGSGAFPMGLLNELYQCRLALLGEEKSVNIKKEIIQNNIYGVDIEKGAVDIARLRFWLALVVEEEIAEPLPNLDYKIMQGNSLLESYQGVDLSDLTKTKTEREKSNICVTLFDEQLDVHRFQLSEYIKEYFNCTNSDIKKELRQKIDENIRQQIEEQRISLDFSNINLSANSHFFLWHTYFGNVFNQVNKTDNGFDIVIGNPPYIQLQKDGGKLAKMYENQGYQTFARTGDIYSLFYEKGYQILKPKGILVYITSNKWMRAGYGEATRSFFAEKTNPLQLIDFAGIKVFESAAVDANILIFAKENNTFSTRACIVKDKELKKLSDYIKQNSVEGCRFDSSESWVILSEIEQRIKAKIEAVGTPLKDWDINIYRGILTGCNEAFIIDKVKKEEILANCQTDEERQKTAEIIRPILRGRDIKRYGYEFADLYIITTFPSLKIDIESYPAIKQYLMSFGYDRLKQTGEKGARKKTNNKWFETQDSIGYWEDFSKQKIVYSNMCSEPSFYLDENRFLTNQKCFILTGKHLKFLISFFNSKLFKYAFWDNFPVLGAKGRELSKIFMIEIPVIEPSKEIEIKISNLLDYQNYEEIDKLIYELYNLTDEEISFIENT